MNYSLLCKFREFPRMKISFFFLFFQYLLPAHEWRKGQKYTLPRVRRYKKIECVMQLHARVQARDPYIRAPRRADRSKRFDRDALSTRWNFRSHNERRCSLLARRIACTTTYRQGSTPGRSGRVNGFPVARVISRSYKQ